MLPLFTTTDNNIQQTTTLEDNIIKSIKTCDQWASGRWKQLLTLFTTIDYNNSGQCDPNVSLSAETADTIKEEKKNKETVAFKGTILTCFSSLQILAPYLSLPYHQGMLEAVSKTGKKYIQFFT